MLSDWEGVSLFCLCDVTLMSLEVTGLLFLLHRSPDAPGELLRLHRPRFSCLCNRLTIPGLSRLRLMIAHRRLGEPGVSLSSVPVADAVPDSSYSDTGLVCRCFREKGLFKHISKPVIKSQQRLALNTFSQKVEFKISLQIGDELVAGRAGGRVSPCLKFYFIFYFHI